MRFESSGWQKKPLIVWLVMVVWAGVAACLALCNITLGIWDRSNVLTVKKTLSKQVTTY